MLSRQFVWFKFAKIRGAKIILHAKSPAFRAAKLKGFTVLGVCYIAVAEAINLWK